MEKIYGEHATWALLNSKMKVDTLYVESTKRKDYSDILMLAKSKNIQISVESDLSKHFLKARHQGIGAVFKFEYAELSDIELPSGSRILMLDRVQDPHNFGACMRSAAAFGVSAVIVPTRGQSPINEIVHQASCGGTLLVPVIQAGNLSQIMSEMKDLGIWFVATSEHADTAISDLPQDRTLCLVMGSEGDGVKQKLFDACDYQVMIHTSGLLSTLNVSVATGVLLHALQP